MDTTSLHDAMAEVAQDSNELNLAGLPRPLVFTNGVFDLVHAGHVRGLQQARCLGRSLVVGVNSDASVRRSPKGPGRPICAQAHRLEVLKALTCVDAVCLFDEDNPLTLIRRLRPDIYVKGDDYKEDQLEESRLVRSWGGRTVILPRIDGLSTTALVEKLLRAHAEDWSD